MIFCIMIPVMLRGLSKFFGPTAAVDTVDLDIPAGSLFFLLGPSGCGKTTILRMLAGFTDPTAGRIRFGPRDVTDLPANRRNTGMCFQSYALWPHLTVAANVAFGLQVRKVAAAEKNRRVRDALDLVQMNRYAQRKPNELSGGQQQRVALARALVVRPDVLLLDEPLSNLDAKLRLEMRGQIRNICRQARITTVYVTHDQKEALSMADRMAVLRDGKVAQVGRPADLYHRPASRFVADFLGETNFLPAVVAGREEDRLVLDCAGRRLCSRSFPADLAVGAKITCSIRPEAVRLVPAEEALPAENCLPVRIVDTVYLGEVAQHQLALSENLTLKVLELNPRPDAAGNPNPRIAFDPRDVVVLRD